MENTILADNTALYDLDCSEGFISAGYNLVEDDTGCIITGIEGWADQLPLY
ncbi:MAG: hypothetical protein JW704_05740 [Anaerolineaceae bacterium]|nr:hypothetical protein [Anaerolineaceae bacterium]MBN2676517.1 hypothetical protein [Anaerolineaceae bacterium]